MTYKTYVVKLDPATLKKAKTAASKEPAETPTRHGRQEIEPPRLLELEAENRRLRLDLEDAQETADILKTVLADMRL